jgi:DNA polymerase I
MTLITPDNFDKSLSFIEQCEEIAVDTETYWTDSWDNKLIIGISIYGESNQGKTLGCYYPFRHEWEGHKNLDIDSLERLSKVIDEIPQLYHNAKFDRQEFVKEGIYLKAPFFCTMVASHMINENDSHELEDLAERFKIDPHANARKAHLHAVRKHTIWHQIPAQFMVPYACGDTRNTFYLAKRLRPILAKQEMDHLWETEEAYSDALMHVEINGIPIDPDMADEFSVRSARRMGTIKKELGFDPGKPLALATKLFIELGLPMLEIGKPSKQFPRGRPTMNEATFVQLAKIAKTKSPEANKVMDLVLEYRGLQKRRSTWYEGWPALTDKKNTLHPTFHQHGTVTTRLSSVGPNMQQIPREDEEGVPSPKKLVRAPVGYELWQADYSQIEYRLAGVLSGDPVILDAYRSGQDMHSATATRLSLTRQQAKTTNFLFIYEGGPGRWAEVFDRPLDEAKSVYSGYHQLYNVMFKFASSVNTKASERGWIRLWDGRRRHFKFHFETKKAWNSYVQGGAARIIQKSVVAIHRDTTLLSKVNNQVHDALWFAIPSYAIHTEMAKLTYHMEWPSRDKRFKINFPVDWTRIA